jgi:hypothetical protein
MEEDQARRISVRADQVAARRTARTQRWASGVAALLLLLMCWGAWVCLLGYRPCALSYLLWR